MSAKSGKSRLRRMTTLYGLSVLVAVTLAELYLRSTHEFITPGLLAQSSLKYIPAVSARHVLAAEPREVRLASWGGIGRLQVNSMGYRGRDFDPEKHPGVTRIMIYGGSAVFDQLHPHNGDWPARVEEQLRRRGHPVEVINAGIPGHASSDSLGRFLTEGHAFRPDIVILYNAWNDIKLFHEERSLLRALKPYVAGSDPRINYYNGVDRWLSEFSQVYVRLRMRYLTWRLQAGPEGTRQKPGEGLPVAPAAVAQYRFTAKVFVRAVRAAFGKPVLVTQARLVSPDNDQRDRERIGSGYVRLAHDELVRAFELAERALAEVAEEERASIIDVSEEMNGRREFFADHVHLTGRGSERLAELVVAGIEPLLASR